MDDAPGEGPPLPPGAVWIANRELTQATVEVAVAGELDLATAPQLKWELNNALGGGYRRVILNLEGVTFIDSTALSVLVGFQRGLGESNSFALVCRCPRVLRTLSIAGLDGAFMIFPTTAAARLALEDETRR